MNGASRWSSSGEIGYIGFALTRGCGVEIVGGALVIKSLKCKGMTMATVTIEIPDDAFAALHRSPKELSQEIRLAAAMIWYTQGRISHESAAQFSGVSRIAFIDALSAAKLPAFHVDMDELIEEVGCARQAIREHVAPGVPGSGESARYAEGGGS
jgi:predicted HTH domain antitoxin